VADAQNSAKKAGLTRGKAILIAVLAVVLVVVLFLQFGGASAAKSTETIGHRPNRSVAAAPPASTTAKPSGGAETKPATGKQMAARLVIDESRWKPPKLAAVVAYDPFALPASFPQPARVAGDPKSGGSEGLIAAAAADDAKRLADAVEELRKQLKELEERGVHVIIREPDQYAAVIGDRMLHVGDEINGFTVTAIDPNNGVRVERKQSP
jgi:hypothetical protein